MLKLGVISDTHGFYRDEIDNLFYDCNHIFHAGDIGNPAIIERLQRIAPTTWVKGNCDFPSMLPPNTKLEENIALGGFRIYMTHQPEGVSRFLEMNEFDISEGNIPYICIHGHTHIERIDTGNDSSPAKLIFNPGSASRPRGFRAQPSVGIIEVEDGCVVSAEILNMNG